MIKYIAKVNQQTAEIEEMLLSQGVNPSEGAESPTDLYIVYIYDNLEDLADFMETHYYDFQNNVWVQRSHRPNPVAYWTNSSWSWDTEAFWNYVRKERNDLLKESDWAVLPDSPLISSDKNEAEMYRHLLRDITLQAIPASGRVEDLVWPLKPSFL